MRRLELYVVSCADMALIMRVIEIMELVWCALEMEQ